MPETFTRLAETARHIAETRGSHARIAICAHYLREIGTEEDLNLAVRFLAEGAFPAASDRRSSVGSLTYSTCAAAFCEVSYEAVFKPCRDFMGSAEETIEKLMANTAAGREKRTPDSPSLRQVAMICEALSRASSRVNKQDILWETWTRMTPVEIKYFLRIMNNRPLGIGLETRHVIVAVARAFNREIDDVGYAHMITGSAGRAAVLARAGKLEEASFRLFQPLSFMLAESAGQPPEEPDRYLVEEKLEGLRCQLHVSGMRVALFARDRREVTDCFPEVVGYYAARGLPDLVLDGQVCVFKNGELHPWPLLQKRLDHSRPSPEVIHNNPVIFIAYDLLYEEAAVFDEPLEVRRDRLHRLAVGYELPVASQTEAADRETLDRLLERALDHGSGGLVLKRKGSPYAYGTRGRSWLKLKEPSGTLPAVILYAHSESSDRKGPWTSFTLGVCVRGDERYGEEFVPIGKADNPFSGRELGRLGRMIRERITDRYGTTVGLKPEVVVEVEFDGIEVNRRTKANHALRNPRIRTIREDLEGDGAATLRDVEKLLEKKLHRNRLKQDRHPSFRIG